MQKTILFVFFALLSTMLIVEKCDGDNLVELLQAEQYTVMYDFVNRFPDLVTLLTNETVNTTIFAPTNAAFNSIITDDLHNILLYHFVAGENPTSIFTNNELLPSLLILSSLNDTPQKTKVTLNETTLFINQAQVIQSNVYASNGVIHGINAVLSPPGSIVNIASTTPDFSTLYAAIVEAELSSALEGPALTAFAPSNEAFAALAATSPILVGYLLANDTQARGDLQTVLKYHVTGSIIYAGNIPSGTTLVPSLEGANLTVTNNNGAITVNGAAVTAANVLAANGVIHAIDQVLLPKSFNLNLRQTLLGLGLTTLVDLVESAGLTNLLTGPANFTIFAPTNAAFSALPNPPSGQALIDVLSYHLTTGQVLSTLLSDGTLLPSLLSLPTLQQNQQLKVIRFEDVVGINNANITNANNLASNGLVHVIDRVLIPPQDIAQVANATASLSTLVAAAKAAGLLDALSTTGNLTVFAPDNAAFAAASSVVSYLLTPQGLNDLQNVLLNHVVADTVLYAPSITTTPTTYPTLNGENVTVVRTDGQVEVDSKAKVLVPDVLASNGVAHVIDTVLLPSNFEFTLEKALIGVGATDLLAAINAAGLHDILNGTTEYTIFAPTNEAFARHPPPSGQALIDLLKYHVVAGRVLSFQNGELFPSLLTLNSLDGAPQQLKSFLSGSNLFMNGVNVTGSATAINGLVYVISDVFTLPPSIEGVVNSTFNVLAKVVQLAELNGPLDTMSNITLFAPTDTAFSKLSTALLNYLLMPEAKADLASVLYYHVVPYYVLYSERIPSGITSYVTINGASVSVDKSAGGVSVNNAAVVQTDLLAANGVVHGIDNVLLPPGFAFDLQRALVGLDATTLLAAIHEAGFDSLLNGTTNYTIFAPTNAAFTALGNVSFAELVQILRYHVVPGYIASNELNNGQLLPTLLVEATLLDKPQPVKITLDAGRVWVNGINVTIPDNFASNGVIHVIDAVLIPPKNIPTVATSTPALSTLVQLLSAAELVPTLSGGNLTVFAPENSAFSALGEALLTYLLLPSSKSDLVSILGYHVLPNAVVYSAEVPTTPTPVPTLNGADVTVSRQGTTVTVNSATVLVPDVLASNGVVHVINEVLIPPGFSFNLRKALEALDATVLINLIDKVGLSDILNSTANFTIFAPTNAALNALPNNLTNAEIAEILKYHVVAGFYRKNSLTNGELLPSLTVLQSLGGQPQLLEVTLSGGSFLINDVNVTSADSLATNGVIHVINEVLSLPPTLPEVAAAAPDFSKLVTLVEAAGIADALKQNNLTLFAPTNEGFASLGPAIYNFLLLPAAKDELVSVLTYHAVGDNILYSTVIPEGETKLKTLNGADITVNKKTDGSITVNTANVVVPNILAANGVAHGIDGVLLPPGFVFDLRRVLIGINATSLLAAIHLAGLDGILNGTTNYTIFAPSDEAFASFNKTNVTVAELADILKYHVVPGTIKSTDLSNGQLLSSLLTLPTLNNKQQRLKVNVTGNQVYINNALVTIANNVATNGIVHEINMVLSPPSDIGTVARATPSLSTLVRLIQIVEEEQRFINPNMTALAPSNAAFNSLGAATLSYLLSPQAEDALENILLYHIIPNHILYTPDITGTIKVTAANGLDVTFVKSGNKVTVNGASLTVPNVLASNGVAHILNAVLLPSNFHFTLLNALEGLNETELMAAFEAAGLFSILNGTANYTIFAPTPEAFQKHLPKGVASLSTKDLVALLQTHIVAGRFPLEDGMQLPTLNNKTLIVGTNETTITLSGTKVTAELLGKGNAANNGMLFSIDKVLAVPGGNDDDDDDGLSTTWIIVIVVVCSAAVIAVLGVAGYFGYTYWQKKQNSYVAIGGDYEDS